MNGLKKRLNYPEFIDLVENFDVFCALETHIDSTDNVDIQNYEYFSKNRGHSYKRKSGGIGVYVRKSISRFVVALENKSEYILWLKFDKHFLHIPEDLIFGAIYIPPENSRFFNNDDLNEFEQEISHYSCNNNFVMLAGDTNSRTGSMKDFVSTDRFTNELLNIDEDIQSDLDKYTILENLSIPLTRYSRDKKTNTHGHRLIQICQSNNIFIVNGRIYNDKELGKFTFRDKSVIDYVLSTAEWFRYYSNFEIIETDSLHSDWHSVIVWEFKCKPFQHVLDCDSLQNDKKLKYIWDNNLIEDFCLKSKPGSFKFDL